MARWTIHPTEDAVLWTVEPGEKHVDDYEMAGYRCAFVVTYGADENGFVLKHHPIFPTLRLRPNNTHATYQLDIPAEKWPMPALNGEPVREVLRSVKLNGTLEIETESADGALRILRRCCPSTEYRAAYELLTVTACGEDTVSLKRFSAVLKTRGDSLGVQSGVRMTEMNRTIGQIDWLCRTNRSKSSPFDSGVREEEEFFLNVHDNAEAVRKAAQQLGYDLSEEDAAKVYDAFVSVASKKGSVSAKELDVLIATSALQVPPAYRLESYMINASNVIAATSHIRLKKDGQILEGICAGDGPIDASFLAIEQIAGTHYELDDFQIRAVTEGREAMGEAIVRLRSNGKLYSGRGISTDIVGSSIMAYINAINKIVYEEAEQ